MTIALARDVEAFLQEQVREGVCTDASELVNDVLRLIRDQRQRSIEITPELETWLLEAADRPTTPLTSDDFTRIKTRVRASLVNRGGPSGPALPTHGFSTRSKLRQSQRLTP